MCGIAGDIRLDDSIASTEAVRRMVDAMAPRGPDGCGLFAQDRVALGHRRLKIIDLSDRAQQPMVDPDLGLTVVFNGAIYNYRELRDELCNKGYRFFSTGDTEVILKAFHAWGPDCVERLSGMFAFAVWERESGRVTLARDRLGVKPLYYTESDGSVRFASSLPALLAAGDVNTDIDPVALNFYMNFHAVVPAPHTILKGIRKLPPATVTTIASDGARTERTYWTLRYGLHDEDAGCSETEWQERILEALRLAVRRRLVADVPVGVLLSGGIDSSLIVGLLAEEGQTGLNTFSVGFETVNGEAGNEFEYSDIIAAEFGTNHHKIPVDSARGLLPSLPDCIHAMAEPMVSHDVIGFYLLAEEVSKHLKVVQSGQGADEVFGGYHWYPPLLESDDAETDYGRLFRDRSHQEYLSAVHPRFRNGDHAEAFIGGHFGVTGAERPIDKAMRLDSTIMLVDDPVKRIDNMTMAWGLEARVPFLDHDLVELAARAPAELKVTGDGKHVLKEAARSVVPNEVIDRPKGYFPVPALKYLKGEVLEMVRTALSDPRTRDRAIFEPGYVDVLLQNPEGHITPLRGSKLWQVTLLELWLQSHGI